MVQRHGYRYLATILDVPGVPGSGPAGGQDEQDVPGSWFQNIEWARKWVSACVRAGSSAFAMRADRHSQEFLGGCLAFDDATLRQWGGWLEGSPGGCTNWLEEDADRAICTIDDTED